MLDVQNGGLKQLTPERVQELLAMILEYAMKRNALWQKALHTATFSEILDDVPNRGCERSDAIREIAARLLGATNRHARERLVWMDENGFYPDEKFILDWFSKEAPEPPYVPENLGTRSEWQRVFEYEESISSNFRTLEQVALRSRESFKDIQHTMMYDLAVGPASAENMDFKDAVEKWASFVNWSHGDLDKALKNAREHNWKSVPEEYLIWRSEREIMLGNAESWKAALLESGGDLDLAAEKMGFSQFMERLYLDDVLYVLGLKAFSERLRVDHEEPVIEFIIYGLRDPNTKEIRWVGQSKRGLIRPQSMISPKAVEVCDYGCGDWLRELRRGGFRPEIVVLERCATVDELNDAECRHIAEQRRLIGDRLTNVARGGSMSTPAFLSRSGKSNNLVGILKTLNGDVAAAGRVLGCPVEDVMNRLTAGQKKWLKSVQGKKS